MNWSLSAKKQRDAGDHRDILDVMRNAKDRQTGERLSDENIRYQLMTFLAAGQETTSGLLSFAICELLRHPMVMERAREEVARVLGNQTPCFEHLQLSYRESL